LLTIGTRDREFAPRAREMAIYKRIAHHIASSFRCRRRLGLSKPPRAGAGRTSDAPAEAVLDAEGRIVHAEGEAAGRLARERIRAAAQTVGALRRRGSKSQSKALEEWPPLVAARWTLVDSFEKSGERYVVARENQARHEGMTWLTDRERQVVLQAALGFSNKEIAYALGISHSTVRVLMARAARRLGARSRDEMLSHPSLRTMRRDS
jgi:DNA-binding CsgD family transcriptional regulator